MLANVDGSRGSLYVIAKPRKDVANGVGTMVRIWTIDDDDNDGEAMSYRLAADEPLPDGIRRIAVEQIDRALNSLEQASRGNDFDDHLHDVRKRCKKLRAVVRLVRDVMGKPAYKHENICFRDTARELSAVRDAAVLLESLDALTDHYGDELAADAFASVRGALAASYDGQRQAAREHTDTLPRVEATFQLARERIAGWHVDGDDWSVIRPSLLRVYKRGYRAMQRAWKETTDESLHEWRKRAKYLWYHCRILRNIWPNVIKELGDSCHDLTGLLGDDHDLAVLGNTLRDDPDSCSDRAAYDALLGLIGRRRRELQDAAWPLGRRLYAEDAEDFVDRLGVYWQSMRDEVRRAAETP